MNFRGHEEHLRTAWRLHTNAGLASWEIVRGGNEIVGYGILQVSGDEAHLLNVCVRNQLHGWGFWGARSYFF
ncbi:MAG: hypothetical protein Ct9H300mP8_01950 [Gammaproteobacteria bacterium]|nr:MAG: hypothetical protein Ct9H300mP8_01950 [Gammaproteobacteria bacterium]